MTGSAELPVVPRVSRPFDRAALAIGLLAILASATGLANGFAYDDRWIVVNNPTVHDLSHWWSAFTDTYWPQIRNAALYRPFTILLFKLQWAAGEGTPLVFHAVNVLLYAVASVLVYHLALEILPRAGAWVAAALFAVHPVHVEAVGNVVGQAELWCAIAIIGAVTLYLRGRRGGAPLDRKVRAAIMALYLGGMLFKENAIVLPALLVAAEAFLVRDARPWRTRADELFSSLVWLTLIAALFLWVRIVVTGTIGGDVEHAALRNLTMGQRAWVMLALAPEFARLLVWPQHLSADYSPRHVPVLSSPDPGHTAGALLILCMLVLAIVAARRWPLVTFALAWIAITLAPVANILLPTGILIAERTLFLPSVAAVLAAAALVPWAIGRLRDAPPAARIGAAGVVAILIVAGAAHSAERQPAWKDSEAVFQQMNLDAPFSFKTHYANGGMLWEAKRPRSAELEWRYAIALYPEYFGVYQELAHRYREAHICPAAIPNYLKALEIEPGLPFSWVGLAACYLEIANFRQARAVARRALADSLYRAAFEFIICKADSSLVANDSLDATIRWIPTEQRLRWLAGERPTDPGKTPKVLRDADSQNARSPAVPGFDALGPVTARRCKSLLHSQ